MRDFLRYITRPSGFGRTPWVPAAIIHVAYLGMVLQRIWWNSTAALFVFYFGLFLGFMFWIATWRNWKVDRAGLPTNPKHHMNDVVGEGTPWPTMKEPKGAPILEFKKWFMARYECNEDQYLIRTLPLANDKMFRNQHRAYLKAKRFDKFLRK